MVKMMLYCFTTLHLTVLQAQMISLHCFLTTCADQSPASQSAQGVHTGSGHTGPLPGCSHSARRTSAQPASQHGALSSRDRTSPLPLSRPSIRC